MRFTGVCLTTPDVLALAGFYARVLGSKVDGDHEHAELRIEGAGLAIFCVEGMERMAPRITRGLGHGGCTLMFEVPDVDAAYERLRALGVAIVKPPATYPWGTRSVWFKDPDGNLVDFYAHVAP